ncbi:MAG: beta-galactosidase [Ruminococcaceae bacterium]|nr:beta-galactosidase [Oscillospiraceae bacterium]
MSKQVLPRPEYPRPQFVRNEWLCLNGEWDFTVDNARSGEERALHKASSFDRKITVPFCPESRLSGLELTDFMSGVWYTRAVTLPDSWQKNGRRTHLHIGACDYLTKVFVNGREAGTHRGGYISFAFDITPFLQDGENRITVYACDDTRDMTIPSGKQSRRYGSHGCYYTRTTGIWQTVWLENTPAAYIKNVKITPNAGAGELRLEVRTVGAEGQTFRAEAFFGGRSVGRCEQTVNWDNLSLSLPLSEIHLWEMSEPNLYDLVFTLGEDRVESYAGLRDIAFRDGKTYLNGKPVFQRLILDQGFYPDGIYTAPSDEELKNDILRSMAMGYNGARLHEKIFEPRFLYHADRLGYLLWGEYPNWGLNTSSANSFKAMLPEWLEELERDYNHPAIIGWCPLNETPRTIDADLVRFLYHMTKAYDPTRLFIDNSGWFHIAGTYDIFDVHDYNGDPVSFRERYLPLAEGKPADYLMDNDYGYHQHGLSDEITFVSEFGGARWVSPEKRGEKNDRTVSWGYGDQEADENAFIARYKGLVDALLDNPAISAFCYTQLTDVEQEQNGLYTYDRKPKFDPAVIAAITSRKAAIEE